jgi:alpha-glucoside transport system substrate-binding protein
VSGDFAARFTDNPAAEGLLAHILQGDAWVQRSQGRIYPVRVRPDHEAYGPLARRVAGQLSGASLRCLDASDAMPATMAAAFHTAVLEFIADPDQLKGILPRLEEVRSAIPEDELLEVRCTG